MRFPQRAIIGVIFVMQYFTDSRVWIFAGMIAQRTVIADLGPQFFKHRNFFFNRGNACLDVFVAYAFHFLPPF
jgi:hypothetical protein